VDVGSPSGASPVLDRQQRDDLVSTDEPPVAERRHADVGSPDVLFAHVFIVANVCSYSPRRTVPADPRRRLWSALTVLRTYVRMSQHGTAYGRFLRALDSGNEVLILSAARQLPRVALNDALRICLVLRDGDPDRYERAAVRWLGRFALEALPDQPAEAMERLQRLCITHGLS
jgi:hypothetical protein